MIADKYAKALFSALQPEEWEEAKKGLEILGRLNRNPRFLLVVKSPLLGADEKVQFISDVTGISNQKFLNFVKIVLINKRVDLFKSIFQTFNRLVANANKKYRGVVEGEISYQEVKELENRLGEKFNAQIELDLHRKRVGGIKLFIDVLDVEVSLVEQRVKEELIQSILKAI
ncbi:MAG: F0F1 ATP synthase subunit delta [Campylobacterales bacterium]